MGHLLAICEVLFRSPLGVERNKHKKPCRLLIDSIAKVTYWPRFLLDAYGERHRGTGNLRLHTYEDSSEATSRCQWLFCVYVYGIENSVGACSLNNRLTFGMYFISSHLVNFPFGQLPTLSIPTLSIPTLSSLNKWELTKWGVDQMGIDKVGIDKVGRYQIYHVRNVIGRENSITCGWTNELTHALMTEYTCCGSFMVDRIGLDSTTLLHYLAVRRAVVSVNRPVRSKITLTYSLTWQTDCCNTPEDGFQGIIKRQGSPFLSFAQAFSALIVRINCLDGVLLKHGFVYCRLRNYGHGHIDNLLTLN